MITTPHERPIITRWPIITNRDHPSARRHQTPCDRATRSAPTTPSPPCRVGAPRESSTTLLLSGREKGALYAWRADALPEATVGALFRIPELQAAHPARDIDAMDVSALTGLGLQEMLGWIVKRLPES